MRVINTRSLILAGILSAVAMVGCSKNIKPEVKKPVRLIEIDNPMAALNPIFHMNLSSSGRFGRQDRLHKKDIPALQVAFDDTYLFGATPSGAVEAFEMGHRIWSINVGEPIVSGVAYDQSSHLVLVGTRSGRIVALDGQTGAARWEYNIGSSVRASALIAGNRAILSANDGIIHGLNLQNGTSIWQFGTQSPNISVRGAAKPLRLDGNTVLFGTADGRIHAVSIDQGKPLWTRRVGVAIGGSSVGRMSDVDGTPLVVDNHLYVTSFSGNLTGFDMSTGRTLFSVKGLVTTHALAHQHGVLIGVDADGMIHGFDRQNGTRLWENNALLHRKPTEPVVIGNYIAIGDLEGVVHLFTKEGNLVGRATLKGKNPIVSLTTYGNRLAAQTASGDIAVWELSSFASIF